MGQFTRRTFLEGIVASGAAAATARSQASVRRQEPGTKAERADAPLAEIDFRYAPRLQQATICFPNDPKKTLVGQAGDLRYGFTKALNGPTIGVDDFASICMFSLAGLQDDRVVRQWLEAPNIPIVHTLIERTAATLELTAFATRHGNEGRVDNVLVTIRSKQARVAASPRINIRTCLHLKQTSGPPTIAVVDENTNAPFLVVTKIGPTLDFATFWEEAGYTLYLPHGEASHSEPLQYLIRFPQEGQSVETVQEMLAHPEVLADEAREFWKAWQPFGSVDWGYPGKAGEFLVASARNIQQAREVKNGRLVFQVGPTLYRNLWIVDGNFLLEAARYLGYDQEADEGLLSEWAKQLPSGQIVAAGGGEHWKDTAIAMFTLVRQCELKQDWKLFKDLEPDVLRAVDFLVELRDKARAGTSTNGRYGLLPPGFADGGIGGIHSEFTNTLWVLAGLQAVADAAERLRIDSLQTSRTFYNQLRAAFSVAARAEMVHDPRGFNYLPMLARDDPAWQNSDPWARPRPQIAQWALSHAIFPGSVFAKDDPIVTGHIALMQACAHEDIPAETGWLWHEAVWTYNACFAAHVYLWAGLPELADRTFRGFLNHASPLYCWREEQPLQHALLGQDWGDMPHNWASAECVRYLRHMFLLEDGQRIRFLESMMPANFAERERFRLEHTPTRFGRITMEIEPIAGQGWRLDTKLEPTQTPQSMEIPISICGRQFDRIEGARYRPQGQKILIDPRSRAFTAFWR